MSSFEFPEPDTSMVFEFGYTDEFGIPQATRLELTGENAEHLPFIIKKFYCFLKQCGFDADIQVVDDATKRIGPAIKALIEEDAKACAAVMLMVVAVDLCSPPIGMIGQGAPPRGVAITQVHKPEVALGNDPPSLASLVNERFPGLTIAYET